LEKLSSKKEKKIENVEILEEPLHQPTNGAIEIL